MADTSPGDGSAERLKRWATEGEGAAHFGWGTPGDFDRCVAYFKAHAKMSDHMAKGYCSNLHLRATGARPGRAPGEQAGRHGGT